MSDDSAAPSGREYGRALFVCACALSLILAAALLPAITASFGQTPVESVVSGQRAEQFGGTLGALNPGSETTVGGLQTGDTAAFRSQSTAIHFVVEATEPGYWRTGAYDTYTGSVWRQSGAESTDSASLAVDGLVNRTVSYEVRLNRSASALPTVWRPKQIETATGFEVTAQRAIRASTPLSPGDTYRATSALPPRNPAILSTAGREYSFAIEERYTQLPGVANTRLSTFTARLTADAENPYETATQIEQWLETNKTYSLNVSRPDGDSIASDFIFEMDAGYCEYFATSMVAMLRTQGIPARYVVGYSTGQRTGPDTYTVRGMNAHAWVEVYFPDVGWVRFDPTPGSDRLDAERQTLQRQRPGAGSYNHSEEGSPGERFSTDDTSPTEPIEIPDGFPEDPIVAGRSIGTENTSSQGVYDVTLSEDPVPGRNVSVRVQRAGEAVTDTVVLFNGVSIGRTDWTGRVRGTVPYTDRLNVTVVDPAPRNLTVTSSTAALSSERRYAVDTAPLDGAAITNNTTRRTYDLPTDATLSLSGTVATGQELVLTVTVSGQPVADATVQRNGTVLGTTDDAGRLDVTLPSEPGAARLTVTRGAVSGERLLRLETLHIDVEPTAPVALPGTGVTVTARLGNETVTGVPVTINGERVGATRVGGTVTTTLPISNRVTITAAAFGQRETATVGALWLNLGVFVIAPAVLMIGAVVTVRRRDLTAVDLLDRLVNLVRSVPGVLASALVRGADGLVGFGSSLARAIRRAPARLRAYLAGDLAGRELLALVHEWLVRVAPTLPDRSPAEPSSVADSPPQSYMTIREGWAEFLDSLSVQEPETKTPGELATHAVERDGLPDEPVSRLCEAFRAVEYGDRSPADRSRAVETAVERLRGAHEDEQR